MFVKLFTKILCSSIADDRRLRHFFTDLLLCSDATGLVLMTPTAIARTIGASLEEVEWGLAQLEKPDPRSHTPDHEGRRIERVEGSGYGIRILNYEMYRGMKDSNQLREATNARVRRFRAARAAKSASGNVTETAGNASNAIQKEIVEVDADVDASHTCPAGAERVVVKPLTSVEAVFDHYRTYHPRARVIGADERKKIEARLKEGFTVEDLCAAIDGQHRSPHHLGQNKDGKQYLNLELAVRDSSKVNQFLAVPKSGGGADDVIARVQARLDRAEEEKNGIY